jgi:hypothetical protein
MWLTQKIKIELRIFSPYKCGSLYCAWTLCPFFHNLYTLYLSFKLNIHILAYIFYTYDLCHTIISLIFPNLFFIGHHVHINPCPPNMGWCVSWTFRRTKMIGKCKWILFFLTRRRSARHYIKQTRKADDLLQCRSKRETPRAVQLCAPANPQTHTAIRDLSEFHVYTSSTRATHPTSI